MECCLVETWVCCKFFRPDEQHRRGLIHAVFVQLAGQVAVYVMLLELYIEPSVDCAERRRCENELSGLVHFSSALSKPSAAERGKGGGVSPPPQPN